jgi:hypothetical protein
MPAACVTVVIVIVIPTKSRDPFIRLPSLWQAWIPTFVGMTMREVIERY